jgi:hypothetical protein
MRCSRAPPRLTKTTTQKENGGPQNGARPGRRGPTTMPRALLPRGPQLCRSRTPERLHGERGQEPHPERQALAQDTLTSSHPVLTGARRTPTFAMKIDKEYRFQADLFRGLVADHFDAVIPHLNGRDIYPRLRVDPGFLVRREDSPGHRWDGPASESAVNERGPISGSDRRCSRA